MINRGFNVKFIFVMLLVIMLLSAPFSMLSPLSAEKTIKENITIVEEAELIDVEEDTVYEDKLYVADTQIEIVYPVRGKLYNKNYEGVPKVILDLLGCSLVIDRNFQAGATVTGDVDAVEFKLFKEGQEIDSKTDDSPDVEGIYSVRFYSINTLFGIYEVHAIAKYNSQDAATDTEEKVIILHLGETGNKNPVAIANYDTAAWETKEVEFDASESYDPDGEIVRYLWDFGDGASSEEMITTHTYTAPGVYDVWLYVYDDEGAFDTVGGGIRIVDYDLGVWITTKYNGVADETKLDIGVYEFIGMVYRGHSQRSYQLTMETENDLLFTIKFAKTTIQDFDGVDVSAFYVTCQIAIDQSTDLSKDHEVNMEFRFPYSLLTNPNEVPTDAYFTGRVGYHYKAEDPSEHGPHDYHSWFYFGKNSLQDPGILRMKLDPHPYGVECLVPLSYETKFVTVDDNGAEQFHRILAIEFDPAPELTISSMPAKGKINYNFGDETSGLKTTITFNAYGGLFNDITQKFVIDRLPAWMRFDLTIIGERSFKYVASNSFDCAWIVESTQSGELVRLELDDLPTRITVSWGLSVSFASLTASGFIDLDMSSNLGEVRLYVLGDTQPFIQMTNFPAKLRVSASINVPSLSGSVSVSKQSGGTTTLTVPIDFDKWHIDAKLNVNDGSATAEFDLPSGGSNHVMFGLDTNGQSFLGWEFDLIDTTSGQRVLEFDVDGIATQDLKVSWDQSGGSISNFKWQGKVTKFIGLKLSVNYQSADLDITGTWEFLEGGQFLFELNKPVEVTFVDMESETFKIYGFISLYADRKLKLEWELIEGETGNPAGNGWFMIYTFGQPIGNEFHLEIAYAPNADWNYQFGFKLDGYDFIDITRTIVWQTDDRIIPRIWILGDNPLPGDWTIKVLWKGEWYDVPWGV